MADIEPIMISGIVTRFKGNGRRLGYPTANITTNTDAKDGVYFGFADMASFVHHPSIIFVGTPTTMGDTERRVEVHLFDIPDKDYYDENITAKLLHYHRENQTFASVDELVKTMKGDETAARQWLSA